MTYRPGGRVRLLPTATEIAWLDRQVEAEKRRVAEGRRRPQGRPVLGDDLPPPPRTGGAPLRSDSLRGRLAALAVGEWVDLESNSSICTKANSAGVVVRSKKLPSGLFRVTRVPDDAPPGRWPPGRQFVPPKPGSLRALIAALGVGEWFESPKKSARINAHSEAAELKVRVSCTKVAGGYRITRIPDESPVGRWPAKTAET